MILRVLIFVASDPLTILTCCTSVCTGSLLAQSQSNITKYEHTHPCSVGQIDKARTSRALGGPTCRIPYFEDAVTLPTTSPATIISSCYHHLRLLPLSQKSQVYRHPSCKLCLTSTRLSLLSHRASYALDPEVW